MLNIQMLKKNPPTFSLLNTLVLETKEIALSKYIKVRLRHKHSRGAILFQHAQRQIANMLEKSCIYIPKH